MAGHEEMCVVRRCGQSHGQVKTRPSRIYLMKKQESRNGRVNLSH